VLLGLCGYSVVRFPGSQTEGAETGLMVRQQQAHIWLLANNTVPEILHVMTLE
jgi:hypothetical protein